MTLREENEEWTRLGLEDAGKSFKPLNLSVEDKIRHKKLLNEEWDFNLCIFCNKTIEQTGGKKIASSHFIKIFKSDKYLGGTDLKYPYKSFKISDEQYITVKGKKSVFTAEVIEKVVSIFKSGNTPWYCQFCGNRTCSVCHSPSQYLHGVDLLDGGHCGVYPVAPGCVNTECVKHNPDW